MDRHPRVCISAGHGASSRVAGKSDPGANVVNSKQNEDDIVLSHCKCFVRW
jgi:hypothetical protein